MQKKKSFWIGLGLFIVVVYVVVLTPLFPGFHEWLRYETMEDTVVDDTTGVEYRRIHRVRRWGEHAGKKHGRFTTFRQDGGINTRGFYVNDIPDGYWTSYDRQGVVRTWTHFVEGKPVRHEKVPIEFGRRVIVPTHFEQRNEEPTLPDETPEHERAPGVSAPPR